MSDDATGSPPGKVNAAQLGDADLVLRTRSGDRAAFAELWRRHRAAGRTLAAALGSTPDADRVVEEAFTRAYRAILTGGGPNGAFRPHLFTIIRGVAASRETTSREAVVHADSDPLSDAATGEQSTAGALDRSLTHRAFRSLPSRWQEVLWYSEIEQMTPADIAPLLGLTSRAVAQLTSRAREGLRESWVRAHLDSVDAGSDCQWTIERLDRFARHDLGRRDHARVDAHVARCARCAVLVGDANEVSHRLALVLLPLTLGVSASAAYLASVQGGSRTSEQPEGTPVAMPDAVTDVLAGMLGGAAARTAIGEAARADAPTTRSRAGTADGGIRSRATVAGLVAAGVIVAGVVAAAAVVLPALTPPAEQAEAPVGDEPRADFATGAERGTPSSRPSPSPSDLPTISPSSAPSAEAVPADPLEGTGTAPEAAAPSSPPDAPDPTTSDTSPPAPTEPVPPDPGLPEGAPAITGTRSASVPSTAEVALWIDVSGAPGATVQARIRGSVVDAAPLDARGAATLTLQPSTHDLETDARVELRYVAGDRMGRPLGVRLSELLPQS